MRPVLTGLFNIALLLSNTLLLIGPLLLIALAKFMPLLVDTVRDFLAKK